MESLHSPYLYFQNKSWITVTPPYRIEKECYFLRTYLAGVRRKFSFQSSRHSYIFQGDLVNV